MRFTSRLFYALVFAVLLAGCTTPQPRNVDNICHIFREYPSWREHALSVQRRWHVPLVTQMAILHQESKFDSTARPPRTKIFWFIPWKRPTTAYGYAQALNGTWGQYRQEVGGIWARREDFAHAVNFIGWYANHAYRRAHIRPDDTYSLYLAYHEGIGGYMQRSYLRKPWLIQVAKKVRVRAQIYRYQLMHCYK